MKVNEKPAEEFALSREYHCQDFIFNKALDKGKDGTQTLSKAVQGKVLENHKVMEMQCSTENMNSKERGTFFSSFKLFYLSLAKNVF